MFVRLDREGKGLIYQPPGRLIRRLYPNERFSLPSSSNSKIRLSVGKRPRYFLSKLASTSTPSSSSKVLSSNSESNCPFNWVCSRRNPNKKENLPNLFPYWL